MAGTTTVKRPKKGQEEQARTTEVSEVNYRQLEFETNYAIGNNQGSGSGIDINNFTGEILDFDDLLPEQALGLKEYTDSKIQPKGYFPNVDKKMLGHGEFLTPQQTAKQLETERGRLRAGLVKLTSAQADGVHLSAELQKQKNIRTQVNIATEVVKTERAMVELTYQTGKLATDIQEKTAKLRRGVNNAKLADSLANASDLEVQLLSGLTGLEDPTSM